MVFFIAEYVKYDMNDAFVGVVPKTSILPLF